MKRRHFIHWGGIAALLLLLGGVAVAQDFSAQDHPGVWLPYSASDYSDDVDFLYRVIFWVTTAMFVLTEGLLLVFCIIYRRRPGHRPTYTHGSQKAEITWTVVPALMLLGLAIWQIPTWNHIKKKFPDKNDPKVLTVDVLGEQFKWNIRYPGSKAKYKGDFDLTNLSVVRMPFGDTAFFNLRSRDVIHSVFIPHMRVKQDTVPGLRQKLWFKPNRMFLVDLKSPPIQDGNVYVDEDNEWVKKPRMVQPHVFVNLDDKDKPGKDFELGGKYFEKRIAVSCLKNFSEKNGFYEPYKLPTGVTHKVKALYKGAIETGKEWADCDYALGIYEIACAELCGLGHYTMRAFLIVDPPTVYDNWIKGEMEDVGEPLQAWKFWRD